MDDSAESTGAGALRFIAIVELEGENCPFGHLAGLELGGGQGVVLGFRTSAEEGA